MVEHTPGPWKARDYVNHEGNTWIDCYAFANNGKGKCLGGTLATVHKNGVGKGSMEANALLIAAAPELLDALKELFDLLEEHQPQWYLKKHYNVALNALNKAIHPEQGDKNERD